MTLQLFAHPFSSYCQKVLIALYENEIAFDFRLLEPDQAENGAAFAAYWPIGKFPLLVDAGVPVFEATIIIEHLGLRHPSPVQLIPTDAREALPVRMLDRFFDNYVMTPMQRIVAEALRPAGASDPHGVAEARALLDKSYAWLDAHLAGREWATDAGFSLADCAAAPALFYADWAHPLGDRFPTVRDYRRRLLARPSVTRAVDEARPYRHYFPLGAPDRD